MFVDQVTKLLLPLGPVQARAMFGGHGLYLEGVMFGLVADDRLYFKTDDESRVKFAKAGGEPFTYEGRTRTVVMSYCTPPDSAMASTKRLLPWAELALAAAKRAARAKAAKRRRTVP